MFWREPEIDHGSQSPHELIGVPRQPPQPEPDKPRELAAPGVPIPAQAGDPVASAPPVLWSLQQIWSMETGGTDEPGVLWAGTLPGGLWSA